MSRSNPWLVGQYRYVPDQYSWEIPMGGSPQGEGILQTAKRELKEETGLSSLQSLFSDSLLGFIVRLTVGNRDHFGGSQDSVAAAVAVAYDREDGALFGIRYGLGIDNLA